MTDKRYGQRGPKDLGKTHEMIRMREAGCTFEHIGDRFGMTKQGVRKHLLKWGFTFQEFNDIMSGQLKKGTKG